MFAAAARPRVVSTPRPAITVPGDEDTIAATAARCRKMVTKRSIMSAGAVLVPIPGLDFAADIALLMRLVDEINDAFGLSQSRIEALAPNRQVVVYRAAVAIGGAMIGKLVTKELVIKTLATVGVRITAKQAARYVPLAGQAIAAGISFSAMRYVGLKHIADCEAVARRVMAGG